MFGDAPRNSPLLPFVTLGMDYEEALEVVRILLINGAKPNNDVPTSMAVAWLDSYGLDEENYLLALGEATAIGWVVGTKEFDFIRITAAGAAAVKKATH